MAPKINKLAPIQIVAPKINEMAPKINKMAPIQNVTPKINKMATQINKNRTNLMSVSVQPNAVHSARTA